MALAKTHRRQAGKPVFLVVVVLAVVLVCAAGLFFTTSKAQGSAVTSSSTIGVGDVRSSDTGDLTAQDRMTTGNVATVTTSNTQRSITVSDPDPVVVPIAVDNTANAWAKAEEYCTLDPLPTAPHVAPDTTDGTWTTGVASAYSIADNDDGNGNFNTTVTASGRALSTTGLTVAVPESMQEHLGDVVEVCYDGKVVIATVTDTGGFAQYGRVLDLAPGVYKAFGFSSPLDWGTRTISYRFL